MPIKEIPEKRKLDYQVRVSKLTAGRRGNLVLMCDRAIDYGDERLKPYRGKWMSNAQIGAVTGMPARKVGDLVNCGRPLKADITRFPKIMIDSGPGAGELRTMKEIAKLNERSTTWVKRRVKVIDDCRHFSEDYVKHEDYRIAEARRRRNRHMVIEHAKPFLLAPRLPIHTERSFPA